MTSNGYKRLGETGRRVEDPFGNPFDSDEEQSSSSQTDPSPFANPAFQGKSFSDFDSVAEISDSRSEAIDLRHLDTRGKLLPDEEIDPDEDSFAGFRAPQDDGLQVPTLDFDGVPMGKIRGQRLLYMTSIFVSLGVFMFGYDQGVMSGIITERNFVQFFDDPTRIQIGTMVAILELGALLASLAVGTVSEKIGRKRTIILGAFVFVSGGLCQSLAPNLAILSVGRVVSGIGVGLLSTIVPVYQSEISPSHARGRLACIEFTGNIFGYSASVWVDYACSFFPGAISWRGPLLAQCVLGTFLLVGGFFIVESPRWLLAKDMDTEGYRVLNLLFADSPAGTARKEFEAIKENVYQERVLTPPEKRTYREMFRTHKYRVFIACSALMWAQLVGINLISYYAPMVFEEAGFEGRAALLMTGINSLIYLASTVPTWFLVDQWGRRPIFISGGIMMGFALSFIAYIMWLQKSYTPACVAVLVVIYNAAFGYSFGPLAWLYAPEIFADSTMRSKGVSLSTATNWFFNFLVGEGSPALLELITWRLYLIHAVFCFGAVFFVYKLYPETNGVELEDMDKLFAGEL
ncbi:unnamed protein product [Kuraishia capsulata CBS 1993]|uniref:Major facilitator superfamily (MFS) profile domain-containing protein n=1 Tax=Kuraishia capsulata CBS 1993 TaxID=1382522 RepID=W6MKS0_9ASCO|nr:uncharacterized protein KUCA_T00001321001 [Kuraishia capsulata CBS 1993]CDK25352.1 unnamed protein product [Kuraishia capsulata CBS 1993]